MDRLPSCPVAHLSVHGELERGRLLRGAMDHALQILQNHKPGRRQGHAQVLGNLEEGLGLRVRKQVVAFPPPHR
eukprot:13595127-Alexandrium_andersonii.AAC.1